MKAKGYIIILLVIVWVGIIALASAYMFPSTPKNNTVTLNDTNVSNNTTINTTSMIQNQSKKPVITETQAINTFKTSAGKYYGNNSRYVATLYHVQGKPYYSITIISKSNGTSENSQSAVNAVTGKLESPE
ncbi:hypothetical protein Metbo_1502 [Methanobacterium lacus]|uniref:PepSY domain-containing protein n=1 Tax=Methanobacterium lacus (strain AL-21) TaxID=877455 RepID=F0T8I3_METLA|nr:hypothetical protein [Methanobacterium lacus]ADZ09734.1 hypothetical protein Metbo_1502 [Methanobacterium lacus]